jgi:hypothetical protein
MAHEIESMAYFGRAPWHGLGAALEEADQYDWSGPAPRPGWIGRSSWPRS